MESPWFVLAVVGLTSVGSYAVALKGLGLSRGAIRRAAGKTLECVGAALVFFLANLAAGVMAIVAGHLLTWRFVSPYLVAERIELFLVFSLLQGLIFQWWRETSQKNTGAGD